MKMQRIRDLREDNDLKQTDIADYLHISQRTYSHYEKIGFINSITRAWSGNTGNTCESSKEGNEIFFDTINNSCYTKKCKGFCRGKKESEDKRNSLSCRKSYKESKQILEACKVNHEKENF